MSEQIKALFRSVKKEITDPPVLAEKEQFLIKLAETDAELERAFRLRYKVFNLEQGKGLDAARASGMDRDEFDDYCMHLVIVEKQSGEVVGTYRMHLGSVAGAAMGFYSSREFHITGIDKIASKSIEVGRSCVSPEHRNGTVVGLLWRGITELMVRSRHTYLFGCVSLETRDPAAGWALHTHFQETGKISSEVRAEPKPGYGLANVPGEETAGLLGDKRRLTALIPPLLKGYLRLGAKVCGAPVMDNEFGTIDFLILLNMAEVPGRYTRHFSYTDSKED
jgi:putative hemolysin